MRKFESPEAELEWLIKTQEDGGLRREPGPSRLVDPSLLDFYYEKSPTAERDETLVDLIYEAMEQLPEDIRDVVEAHVFQGLGVRRTARLDWIRRPYGRDGEIPHQTVHHRLRAGLRQLREILEDEPIIKEHLK